jgi:UDP-GlcNAc3NAcA epimerase
MYRIISIIGARPQFIKVAALCRIINKYFSTKLEHNILHTGQHYDNNMSDVFFDELGIDTPAYQLGIHTNHSGFPLNEAVLAIESILQEEHPDMVLVYGDTYSTLAGSIAAENCKLPLAHIEAGMRSYDLTMPEEVNRVETDKRAGFLFCPTQTAVMNLMKEGYDLQAQKPYHPKNKKIMFSGDIMYDNALFFADKNINLSSQLQQLLLSISSFVLTTVHRQHNTDNKERLQEFIQGLLLIADLKQPILFPVHPRTKKMLPLSLEPETYHHFITHDFIHCVEPLSFLEMMYVEKHASMIITDSGGVQKEAYFYKKPCIILRSETEWTELLAHKCCILTDTQPEKILQAYLYFTKHHPIDFPPVFGDGQAARFICEKIIEVFGE